MTKDEALRLALEALEKTQAALAQCFGSHKSEEGDRHRALAYSRTTITAIKAALEAKDEPVGKLQKPTGERAWFTISELNAWADKKLSENPHWVMPKDEPERDDPPPQRTWVELDEEDYIKAYELCDFDKDAAFEFFEAKLKEKNGL